MAGAATQLEQGLNAFRRQEWENAFDDLRAADGESALSPQNCERLAVAAYLLGRDDEYAAALERAHHGHTEAGSHESAIICGFWLGIHLVFQRKMGQANGWFARAQRQLDVVSADCAARGYLELPGAEMALGKGAWEDAYAAAGRAVALGEQSRDANLIAIGRHVQGRSLLGQGRIDDGVALLDEVMVGLVSGELSPIVTGLIYCSVIASCQQVYAIERAREWTIALSTWCDAQPQMIAFTGRCLVHRAEIMQVGGEWDDALREAMRACARHDEGFDPAPPAEAYYQRGEVHRHRGEFEQAEQAYNEANLFGHDVQPGLALLRLSQGDVARAEAAIRRALVAESDRLCRARLLPAKVEIMLAAGEQAQAEAAAGELEQLAEDYDAPALAAMAAHARGAVELMRGQSESALTALRRAQAGWREIDAPYRLARVRELLADACRQLGDVEGGALELAAARSTYERLEAAPDLRRLGRPGAGASSSPSPPASEPVPSEPEHPLTPREVQVLRLVAAGKTTRAIAEALSVSPKTVDRHLSNIFTKIDVTSRSAATAYAYERGLVSSD